MTVEIISVYSSLLKKRTDTGATVSVELSEILWERGGMQIPGQTEFDDD